MTNAHENRFANPDAGIDALLAGGETASIVDGLFALSDNDAAAVPDPWGRLVHDRLQARLAERMRREIGDKA